MLRAKRSQVERLELGIGHQSWCEEVPKNFGRPYAVENWTTNIKCRTRLFSLTTYLTEPLERLTERICAKMLLPWTLMILVSEDEHDDELLNERKLPCLTIRKSLLPI
jgi:hypothetical protein